MQLRDTREFEALDLRAHHLLEGVPLHDVWRVELSGGGPERTVNDLRALLSFERIAAVNPAVRFLFWLRGALGSVFRTDPAPESAPSPSSYLHKLSEAEKNASTVPPGTREGPFRVLFASDAESIAEGQNATVHAFSVYALVPSATGYTLYWAIYVLPVGGITRLYMALIDPFRKWIVYPAVLRHVESAWRDTYRPVG